MYGRLDGEWIADPDQDFAGGLRIHTIEGFADV